MDAGAEGGDRTCARLLAWLDRAGDRLNPVLVKEVRQALRNRRFIATFMLALVAALATALVALGVEGYDFSTGRLGSRAGLHVFFGLYGCFVLIASILVPFDVYTRFVSDRAQAPVDLVQITRLSAGRIMLGKLEAAGVTLVLYLSAMLPFSTFAYLLRGLTPGMLALGVLVIAGAGVTLVNFVFFANTLLPKSVKAAGGLALIACLWCGGCLVAGGVALMSEMGRGGPSARDVWIGVGLCAAAAVPLNALFFTIASARMSFASANKETGPRLALLGLNVVCVAAIMIGWSLSGYEWEVIVAGVFLAVAWWGFVGIFLLAVPAEISERVKRAAPRSAVLTFFLWPGQGRAFAFYVANLALLCGPLLALGGIAVPHYATDPSPWEVLASAILYVFAFPALAAAIMGFVRRAWGRPQDKNLLAATGILAIGYLVVHSMILAILMAYMGEHRVADAVPFLALSPVTGIVFLGGGNAAERLVWNALVAGVMATVALVYFAPLVGRSLAESVRLAARARRERREGGIDVSRPAVADTTQGGSS